MNFLAHIHIADHCQSNILGNFLGDFVKGNPDGLYSAEIVQGIRLHRFVDSYTDNHAVMKEAKTLFSPKTRRFAPIALDVFWDHCLASQWQQFCTQPLEAFCLQAEPHSLPTDVELPERYRKVIQSMWRGRWLESYSEMDNIQFALEKMSTRSMRMTPLADCYDDLEQHYDTFRELFLILYPDVLRQSSQF